MTETADQLPESWEHDYDLFHPGYLQHPESIWRAMRSQCPVAATSRRGGGFLTSRHADVKAVARDPETFSSRVLEATGRIPREGNELRIPPVTSDPPDHLWQRRILLPMFNRASVDRLEHGTRTRVRELVAGLAGRTNVDAAEEFAQHVPVGVIVEMLGVPFEDLPQFSGWVAQLLKEGPTDQDVREAAIVTIRNYFASFVKGERVAKDDGVVAELLARREEEGLDDETIIGMCFLLLIAGIDTTWSAIGSSLWHLATHVDDRDRLIAEPDLMPAAVEEFIRAYAPITIGRVATRPAEVGGCPVQKGDRVLLAWPAANRDPDMFERPDEVILDRKRNPHVAFGLGIHRCLGSGLARMEIRVALEEWLRRIPNFELDPSKRVTWTGGNVRGPEHLHLTIHPR